MSHIFLLSLRKLHCLVIPPLYIIHPTVEKAPHHDNGLFQTFSSKERPSRCISLIYMDCSTKIYGHSLKEEKSPVSGILAAHGCPAAIGRGIFFANSSVFWCFATSCAPQKAIHVIGSLFSAHNDVSNIFTFLVKKWSCDKYFCFSYEILVMWPIFLVLLLYVILFLLSSGISWQSTSRTLKSRWKSLGWLHSQFCRRKSLASLTHHCWLAF